MSEQTSLFRNFKQTFMASNRALIRKKMYFIQNFSLVKTKMMPLKNDLARILMNLLVRSFKKFNLNVIELTVNFTKS